MNSLCDKCCYSCYLILDTSTVCKKICEITKQELNDKKIDKCEYFKEKKDINNNKKEE